MGQIDRNYQSLVGEDYLPETYLTQIRNLAVLAEGEIKPLDSHKPNLVGVKQLNQQNSTISIKVKGDAKIFSNSNHPTCPTVHPL